jgi:hypothetical protein
MGGFEDLRRGGVFWELGGFWEVFFIRVFNVLEKVKINFMDYFRLIMRLLYVLNIEIFRK